jgi:hypothetical protein
MIGTPEEGTPVPRGGGVPSYDHWHDDVVQAISGDVLSCRDRLPFFGRRTSAFGEAGQMADIAGSAKRPDGASGVGRKGGG